MATDDELDYYIHLALSSSGCLIPTTPEEVAKAEEIGIGTNVRLPKSLQDPISILRTPRRQSPEVPRRKSNNQEVEEYARAARDGAEFIPDEVLQRMHKDRNRAEAEVTTGTPNEHESTENK